MTTVDIKGADRLMNIHVRTAEKMIARGILPAARIGRAYVLMERDVLAYSKRRSPARPRRSGKRERSKEMSGEEKRARLDQLEKQRDRLARQALLVTAAPGRD